MNNTSYWADTARLPKFLPLRRDLDVDVTVIGGGIMGVTAAYLLIEAGATVALIERDRFGGGETAHTTAHLTYVTDMRLCELVKTFGRPHAQATWDAGMAAINQIREIIEKESLACEFHWLPGYLHAAADKSTDAEEISALQEDALLAAEFGFDASFVERAPFVEQPGIRFANQAIFHPQKYIAGLLKLLKKRGCQLFENTEAGEIQASPAMVKANGHKIRCKFVVMGTHVPLQGATGTVNAALFQTKLAAYSTYALGAHIPKGTAPQASFWDTADPYFYLRIEHKKTHDYAILGGADHKTGQTRDPERHYARVEKRLRQILPQAKIDHRWSGQVIETNDGLPLMGETAHRQFVATGFAGNGMTFGTLGAMMAADVYAGRKNPWSELFNVNRKKLSSAWDYLVENKDYPFYMAKEWLAKPDADSSRGIKPGEGKIVRLGLSKVAVYRNEKGKLSVKSAVCTHMGCIVRWNATEKTWDCPCHGSRFHPTGEVMAGPAETPLAEKDELA